MFCEGFKLQTDRLSVGQNLQNQQGGGGSNTFCSLLYEPSIFYVLRNSPWTKSKKTEHFSPVDHFLILYLIPCSSIKCYKKSTTVCNIKRHENPARVSPCREGAGAQDGGVRSEKRPWAGIQGQSHAPSPIEEYKTIAVRTLAVEALTHLDDGKCFIKKSGRSVQNLVNLAVLSLKKLAADVVC